MLCVPLYIGTVTKPKSYQIAPNGEKTVYNEMPHTLVLNENAAALYDGPNLVTRTTSYFMSIRFGEGNMRMAIIHKTIHERLLNDVKKTFTIHKYTGSFKQLLACKTTFLPDQTTEEEMKRCLASYTTQMPLTVYLQEDLYASGHRVIDQIKLVTIVNAK